MFEGFEKAEIQTSGARIHLRHGGEGPPLLLLHGNPLMEVLGYKEFSVAGHDRGARTVHRMCLDHPTRVKRAAVVDILPNYYIEMDTADKDRKVACPLLAIWGAKSHTGSVHGDVLRIWKGWGEEVVGGPIDCGHYVPEEAPQETCAWFVRFFGGQRR